jgi:hypothetical protein
MYDPTLGAILDWVAVFSYIGIAAIVTWRVLLTRDS